MAARNGEVDLMIVRKRFARLPELPGRCASVFCLERAPSSRHIVRRPGHKHRIIEGYRKWPPIGGERSEGEGGGLLVDGVPFTMTLPGVTGVPLPPVPAEDIQRLLASPAVMPAAVARKRKRQKPTADSLLREWLLPAAHAPRPIHAAHASSFFPLPRPPFPAPYTMPVVTPPHPPVWEPLPPCAPDACLPFESEWDELDEAVMLEMDKGVRLPDGPIMGFSPLRDAGGEEGAGKGWDGEYMLTAGW